MFIGNYCIEFLIMIKNSDNIFLIFSLNDCVILKIYISVNFELVNVIVCFKNVLNYDRMNVKISILNDIFDFI